MKPSHPRKAEIDADLAKGIQISYIRAKYKLTRNQAAGYYWRYHFKNGRQYYLNGVPR